MDTSTPYWKQDNKSSCENNESYTSYYTVQPSYDTSNQKYPTSPYPTPYNVANSNDNYYKTTNMYNAVEPPYEEPMPSYEVTPSPQRGRGNAFYQQKARPGRSGAALKRKLEARRGGGSFKGGPGGKRIKKALAPKNPVSLLNELRPGLDYVVTLQEQRASDLRFSATVTIDGETFCGESSSKKEAKQMCSEIALKHFINSPNSIIYQQMIRRVREYGQEITQDKLSNLFYSAKDKAVMSTPEMKEEDEGQKDSVESTPGKPKPPALLLNELTGKVNTYDCISDKSNDKLVYMQLLVNGNKYEGSGIDRRRAKATAAKIALKKEFNLTEEEIEKPYVSKSAKKKRKKESKGVNGNNWSPAADANPTMVLNQVYVHGPQEWECVREATVGNNKEFTMRIVIASQAFEATASNKKNAKAAAAQEALKKLYNIELSNVADSKVEVKSMQVEGTEEAKQEEDAEKQLQALSKASQEKNPTQLLNELMGANVHFDLMSEFGPAHSRMFTIRVECKGQTFEGTGYSKKAAKASAAKAALSGVFGINNIAAYNKGPGKAPKVPPIPEHLMAPQNLADHIGKLVNQRFSSMIQGEETYSRRKVLAGIVMTTGPSVEDSSIICVSTGTKCISGEHMSTEGKSLNDCHAEIISRRCLVHFLITKLEEAADNDFKNSIFEKADGLKQFRVKPNVNFHLFINTAPCGDARIFSPHEASSEEDSTDRHPNRKARGQLRTKIESGEGTIPVKSNTGVQTWDGVMEGQRLLTMSCSDKIARWNVLGLQGSLLSIFLEPVYLQSIILGSLFHPQHMFRATCGRIESTLTELPPPFRLNRPCMNTISTSESRQPGKAPNYSLSWITGYDDKEVINAVTGKDEAGTPSKICKQALFTKWMGVAGKLHKYTGLSFSSPPDSYRDIKAVAKDYQAAKDLMVASFQQADLGSWIKKPMEQDQFTLERL